MTAAFVIRPAVEADAAAVAHVNIASWREAYAHFLSAGFLEAMSLDEQVERWAHIIPRNVVHVAEVDGVVQGFALAYDSREQDAPRAVVLGLIYQLESLHGTGTGQAMLDAAVGDGPAYLWVAEQNPRARRFYERNGFVYDGAQKTEPRWENLSELRMVR